MTNKAIALFRRLGYSESRPARRILVHSTGISAIICLLVASSAGVTFALWTSQATAQGSASKAQLMVAADLNVDYLFQNHQLSTTGSFVISNTTDTASTADGDFTASLSSSGNPSLASALDIEVWPMPSTSVCGDPQDALTGTWGAFGHEISGSLAAGESASYCVRTTAETRDDIAADAGSVSFQPIISAELIIGTWVATASAGAEQKTAWVYPAFTPASDSWYRITSLDGKTCVDIDAEVNTENKAVIAWECKSTGNLFNQQWRFEPSGSYARVISRQAPGDDSGAPDNRAMAVLDASLIEGAAVTMTSVDASHARWQFQQESDDVYQLVAEHSGFCLTPGTPGAKTIPLIQAVCDGSNAQKFKLEFVEAVTAPTPVPVPISLNENARYTITNQGACVASQYDPGNVLIRNASCVDRLSEWRFSPTGAGDFSITTSLNGDWQPAFRWEPDTKSSGVTSKAKSNSTLQLWSVTQRTDGKTQIQNVATELCLIAPPASGSFMSLGSCDDSSATQAFDLQMIGNPNPPVEILSCKPTGTGSDDLAYSWTLLENYNKDVAYKIYVGEQFVKDHANYTWTSVHLSKSNVSGLKPGPYPVELRQSVHGGPWTVAGTSAIEVSSGNKLLCG